MYIDKENLFSDDQAITTTVDSANVVDFGAAEVGPGEPIEILVQVTEDFAGGTSIAVSLETDDNENISSGTILLSTEAIVTASLVAGFQFTLSFVPRKGMEQFGQLVYTVVGTMTAGKITAGVVKDRQNNNFGG